MNAYRNILEESVGDELAGINNEAVIITAEGNPSNPIYILTEEDGTRQAIRRPHPTFGLGGLASERWLTSGIIFTARRCAKELGISIPDAPDYRAKLQLYQRWYKQRFSVQPVLVEWDGRTMWELLAELDPESAFAKYVNDSSSGFGKLYEANVEIDKVFVDAMGDGEPDA